MSQTVGKIVSGAQGWLGSVLKSDPSWVYRLTQSDLSELDKSLRQVESKRLKLEEIKRSDFPLPILAPRLRELLTDLKSGRGFFVIRGLQVGSYSDEEAAKIYWGLGTHLGRAVKQNVSGAQLDHVRDLGKKWGELSVRGYQTSGELIFHTDFSDVVGLLCLRQAKSGGTSKIASAITVHEKIAEQHPEYLATLYRGFRYIRREAVDSDDPVSGLVPVFGLRDGQLSCRIVRERIDAAARKFGIPLSDLENDTLNYFAAVAANEEVCLSMDLLPGDMQFLNNYTILHSRTSYEDGELPHQKRHLLRLWLTMRDGRRPLPPRFPQANGYAGPGDKPPKGAYKLGLSVSK